MTYAVQVHDRAGLYIDIACGDFHFAVSTWKQMRAAYPDKHVQVVNPDRVDLGCSDGLSEAEREAAGQ